MTDVVLKKSKKVDYSLTKAYWLICFERCVSKLLKSFAVRHITPRADALQFIPPNHFGARPSQFAEDAVVCFMNAVRRQWWNGNVVLGIALDTATAFLSGQTDTSYGT